MNDSDERRIREVVEADFHRIEAAKNELDSYAKLVCSRLTRRSDLRLRFVESRVKPPSSILRKMAEKRADVSELYDAVRDIIGARVVVYNLSDVSSFEAEVLGDSSSPLDKVSSEHIANESGYAATHINGTIDGIGCEIQVRTAVQDAWAVTSRSDVYRQSTDPLVSRLAAAQARVLQGVDDVLQAVREISQRATPDIGQPEVQPSLPSAIPSVDAGTLHLAVDPESLTRAYSSIDADARFVIGAPISSTRVTTLKSGVESHFEVVKRMFQAGDAYRREYRYDSELRFGFRQIAFKGPFVEDSIWAEFRSREYSLPLERHLIEKFVSLLFDSEPQYVIDDAAGNAASTLEALGRAVLEMKNAGVPPDVVIISGLVDLDLLFDLDRAVEWGHPSYVRDVAVQDGDWIDGSILGLPYLKVIGSKTPPAVHLVRLSDFEYTQLNPGAESDDDLLFAVSDLDEMAALTLLETRPDLVEALAPDVRDGDGAYRRARAVVELRQRVQLDVASAAKLSSRGAPNTRTIKLKPDESLSEA